MDRNFISAKYQAMQQVGSHLNYLYKKDTFYQQFGKMRNISIEGKNPIDSFRRAHTTDVCEHFCLTSIELITHVVTKMWQVFNICI